MNKKDLIPVILLALLIPLWMIIDRTFIAPKFPAPQPVPAEQPAETPSTGKAAALSAAAPSEQSQKVEAAEIDTTVPLNETIETLENEQLKLKLSSIGGGIKQATLVNYPEVNEENSAPVTLDFSDRVALAYTGLSGIGAGDSLNITKSADGKSVIFSKAWNTGSEFRRTITIGDNYLLTVQDQFINKTSNPWNIPALRLLTGNMKNPDDTQSMKGLSIIGADSYSESEGIRYYGKAKGFGGTAVQKIFKKAGKPESIDVIPEGMLNEKVNWVSAKNKFFVQIISPDKPVATMSILARRDITQKSVVPESIATSLDFQPVALGAGDTLNLKYTCYIGPKNFSILKNAGHKFEKVMEFQTIGFWSFMNWIMEPARQFLLWALNLFNAVVHNYGLAIILLTMLMRTLFWPLTHKSTQKMRENSEKMQVVQPKIKAIQEKYKGQPQRIQQETMKVYQEHGFNPMAMMGGCLPMLLQMPVFFALFTVLRNAIELRYAGFLWIADLSQPENLFAGSIPFIGSLNILPVLMSISMIFQQKLSTPNAAATPEQQQQQKMMMYMMPIMMLFLFYSMPSGLTLYWTTSNVLMIIQTSAYNYRKKHKEA
ncbi:membrane protein insertase YidC [Verrucomicrobia bacterium S94]|nr:membrane protein insertase YidC [Verrucomicrobia bacterium S94]